MSPHLLVAESDFNEPHCENLRPREDEAWAKGAKFHKHRQSIYFSQVLMGHTTK